MSEADAKIANSLVPGVLVVLNSNPASPGDLFTCANGLYIYSLGTKNMSQGRWQIGADLGDGIVRSVEIELK
jgi:hypothetical protein